MSGLVLPKHVYQAKKAREAAAAVAEPAHPIAKRNGIEIYDIDTPVPEGVPAPHRYLLVVMPVDVKDRIGSIFIPDSAIEAQEWTNGIGKVCAVGPGAYKGRRFEEMGLGAGDAPQVGDLVIYNAKTTNRMKVGGKTLIYVADDAVFATVDPAHAHLVTF